jgi:hypothetical protein
VTAPLAVCAGLNEPQLALPQVTVQATPLLAVSFVTVAITGALAPVSRVAGGACVSMIVIAGVVIVTVALTVFVGSMVAVAVMVTVPPTGGTAGAV